MLTNDQKQRLLDAVRDVPISELAEAGAFLVARGEALRDVQLLREEPVHPAHDHGLVDTDGCGGVER